MADKLIFLSHIHEEQELALLIKNALESEFGGFVDVFVSSDGSSISIGTNFLRKIEEGLLNCIGAIYLISPDSLKRNWINFELGAVWVRNATNVRDSKSEIPTMPFCHSGCAPSSLPVPLDILAAIAANQPDQLALAFGSMQKAVGGKGALRTNFDELAGAIALFERKYTVGKNFAALCEILGADSNEVARFFAQNPSAQSVNLEGIVEHHRTGDIRQILGNLSGFVSFQEVGQRSIVAVDGTGTHSRAGTSYRVTVDRRLLG